MLPCKIMGCTVSTMRTEIALTPNQVAGREIKTWMLRTGTKQKDLAELLEMTQAGVSKKLRGDAAFTLDDLLKIAAFFDLSLAELLGEGVLNAKIPSTAPGSEGEKKIAPIGFIPTGATYQVAGTGFEPVTSGL
ncbi:helix-turn-helix domain-containing protein [Rothia sp. P4278]|uniref:helix-turn-helix domain-containing protein n=1 Tax=Rothia sp. P4278 TaxID=3402658 RepID=UPI003AE56149